MSAHTKRLSLTKLVGQVPHEPNCLATLKEFLASPDVCYICNRFASVSLLLWNLQFPSQCARVQFHCCTAMVSFGELRTPIGDLNVFEIGTTILRESRYTYIYIYIYTPSNTDASVAGRWSFDFGGLSWIKTGEGETRGHLPFREKMQTSLPKN